MASTTLSLVVITAISQSNWIEEFCGGGGGNDSNVVPDPSSRGRILRVEWLVLETRLTDGTVLMVNVNNRTKRPRGDHGS